MEYILIPPEAQEMCRQMLRIMEGDWSSIIIERPVSALWFWDVG